jgi:hypothetical protein
MSSAAHFRLQTATVGFFYVARAKPLISRMVAAGRLGIAAPKETLAACVVPRSIRPMTLTSARASFR